MRKIQFKKEKLFELEKFTGGVVYSFFQIGTKPTVELTIPVQGAETGVNMKVKLDEGEFLYKDKSGNIFKKVN